MTNREAVRRRLLRVFRRAVKEHEQIARDIAWWNENRTDAPPFDNGGDIVAAKLGRELIGYLERNENFPDGLYERFMGQIEANAKT